MVYRIICDFFIEAENEDHANIICKEDIDFIENHILISPATEDDLENIEASKLLDPSDERYLDIYNKQNIK